MKSDSGSGPRRTIDPLRAGAAIVLLSLLGLAACANMQISQSTIESTIVQILGLAFLIWLALLIA